MKYAIETDSGAKIYIRSFMKIGSGIQKLMGGYTEAHSAWSSHKPTFIFLKIRK
jgi:hypothetical protein